MAYNYPEWLDDLTDPRNVREMLEGFGYYRIPGRELPALSMGDMAEDIAEALGFLCLDDLAAIYILTMILAGDGLALAGNDPVTKLRWRLADVQADDLELAA